MCSAKAFPFASKKGQFYIALKKRGSDNIQMQISCKNSFGFQFFPNEWQGQIQTRAMELLFFSNQGQQSCDQFRTTRSLSGVLLEGELLFRNCRTLLLLVGRSGLLARCGGVVGGGSVLGVGSGGRVVSGRSTGRGVSLGLASLSTCVGASSKVSTGLEASTGIFSAGIYTSLGASFSSSVGTGRS